MTSDHSTANATFIAQEQRSREAAENEELKSESEVPQAPWEISGSWVKLLPADDTTAVGVENGLEVAVEPVENIGELDADTGLPVSTAEVTPVVGSELVVIFGVELVVLVEVVAMVVAKVLVLVVVFAMVVAMVLPLVVLEGPMLVV